MPAAIFRHGDPVMVDHVAAANITAGDILVIGNTAGWTTGVAHVDMVSGELGALACGDGVYDCAVAGNYAKGTKVYADPSNTNASLTSTSTNMALFGFTVEASAAANAVVKVIHQPFV